MLSAFGVCDKTLQSAVSTFVQPVSPAPRTCLSSTHLLPRVCHRTMLAEFYQLMPSMSLQALMFGIAVTSAVAGIFDLKPYLNLQLVPHISKHHQASSLECFHRAIIYLPSAPVPFTVLATARSPPCMCKFKRPPPYRAAPLQRRHSNREGIRWRKICRERHPRLRLGNT